MRKSDDYNADMDIPLMLNSYNDLFSNFDPRPYSQRALSKDFIEECRKASEDKKKDVHLKLFLKREKRKLSEEAIIIKRIKEHFHKHFLEKKKALFNMRLLGLVWFVLGCFLIVFTTLFNFPNSSYLIKVLIAVSHPAGWFFLWEGMGKIIIHTKEKREDQLFHKKMHRARISFLSD
jgi:hypothetical protein